MYDRKVGYSFTKRITNSGSLQICLCIIGAKCPHRTIHIELAVPRVDGDEDADMNSFWCALRTPAARETA